METTTALAELCARTDILESKMQKNIDDTKKISSHMKLMMEMLRDMETRLNDWLGAPRHVEKQPLCSLQSRLDDWIVTPRNDATLVLMGESESEIRTKTTKITITEEDTNDDWSLDDVLVEPTFVQELKPMDKCSSDAEVLDVPLNEFGALKEMQFEVNPKEIQLNYLLSLSSLKDSHKDEQQSVSKWVYKTEISSDILCTQGVRQNAEENLILYDLRAKPPEEYLNMAKMLKANNALYYGVHCQNVRLKTETKIFYYGSISLIVESYRSVHLNEVEIARESGELLSLDPNLRTPLWPSKEEAHKLMMSIWNQADIIKVSDNELEFLTDDKIDDASTLFLWCPNMKLMSLTCGEKYCYYKIKDFNGTVEGSHVKTINRTGVGDSILIGAGALLRKLVNDHSEIEQVNSRAAPLPYDAKAEDLESFSQLAKVISVRFTKRIAEKRMFSGTALVEFLPEKEAEKVLKLNVSFAGVQLERKLKDYNFKRENCAAEFENQPHINSKWRNNLNAEENYSKGLIVAFSMKKWKSIEKVGKANPAAEGVTVEAEEKDGEADESDKINVISKSEAKIEESKDNAPDSLVCEGGKKKDEEKKIEEKSHACDCVNNMDVVMHEDQKKLFQKFGIVKFIDFKIGEETGYIKYEDPTGFHKAYVLVEDGAIASSVWKVCIYKRKHLGLRLCVLALLKDKINSQRYKGLASGIG